MKKLARAQTATLAKLAAAANAKCWNSLKTKKSANFYSIQINSPRAASNCPR